MGKHTAECTHTWGTCDDRSSARKLPHECGLENRHPGTHLCQHCLKQQA